MISSRRFYPLLVVLLLAGTVLLMVANRNWFASDVTGSRVVEEEKARQSALAATIPDNRISLAQALGIAPDELVNVGGVDRPMRDLERIKKTVGGSPASDAPGVRDSLPPPPKAGRAPRLTGNENAQVAGMLAEMRGELQQRGDRTDDGANDEQRVVTSRFRPEPFDRQAYTADPQAYLDQIRPARVFDPAQPADDVTPLEYMSPAFTNILQDEQVQLRVKADPGSPVAFYTPQTAWFEESLLSSVTVAANDEGIATATLKAGGGSVGLVDVMAASPVHSRQIQFRVKVDLPVQAGDEP